MTLSIEEFGSEVKEVFFFFSSGYTAIHKSKLDSYGLDNSSKHRAVSLQCRILIIDIKKKKNVVISFLNKGPSPHRALMRVSRPVTGVISDRHLEKYKSIFILSVSDPPNRP